MMGSGGIEEAEMDCFLSGSEAHPNNIKFITYINFGEPKFMFPQNEDYNATSGIINRKWFLSV